MTITFPEQFNMATYYLDDRIKEGLGDTVAVYCGDQKYTYADVQRMANRVGNVLLDLGVEMEDRVLIVLPDSIEFVATWFAVAKVGAVITMINTILPAADYEYYLTYTRANVAVVHVSVMERFAPAAARSRHLRHTVVVGTQQSGRLEGISARSSILSYEQATSSASSQLDTALTSRDDLTYWLLN